MRISAERLSLEARSTGFRPDTLEKVLQLLALLESIRSHPFLKTRLVLKGGSALNLFVFPVPRLSVDIDLNYVGAPDLETTQRERPQIEEAIQAVCARQELTVRKIPGDHAGGKWQLRYPSAAGGQGNLEVDVNFMFRVPLWPVQPLDSHPVGGSRATGIPTLDIHELAAGKLVALLARRQARDLFDSHQILGLDQLDPVRLRVGFVVYGAMNRVDWRSVSPELVDFDTEELARQLLPLLRTSECPTVGGDYGKGLVGESRRKLEIVLPFSKPEREFLDYVLDGGEIHADLLTRDPDLQSRIASHPLLQWKAQNVRQHKKLG
jgi:predicted nucleotidyltransferase component of viral defense system